MIESNIYLEMILHTNLDLTQKKSKTGGTIPPYRKKLPFQVESVPLSGKRRQIRGDGGW